MRRFADVRVATSVLMLLLAVHTAFLVRLAQTRLLAGHQRRTDLQAFQAAVGDGETSSESKKS